MINKHKTTFIYGIILAIVIHFYAFSNMIINHDGVNAFLTGESVAHNVGLGRFMEVLLLYISDVPSLPAVIGVLSSIALAVSCCLLSELFDLETKIARFMASAVVISFPVAANTFCYQYLADAFFIAMLCACAGAYLMKRYGMKAIFPAVLLLFTACGIYQAYWSFGAVLLFLIFLQEMLKDSFTPKKFFLRGICLAAPLIISLAGYALVNKAVQAILRVEANGYQGLDQMGNLGGLREIYWTARFTYAEYLKFFFKFGGMRESRLLVAINVMLFLLMAFLLVKLFFRQKRHWYETLIFFLCVLLCPGILNILSFISNNVLHAVMMYAFVLPYLIVISLGEYASTVFKDSKAFFISLPQKHFFHFETHQNAASLSRLMILALVAVVAYSGYLTTNKIYLRQQLNYETTSSYMTRLVLRMETSQDFDPDKPMCFINESCQPSEHIILLGTAPAEMAVFDDLKNMVGVNEGTMIKNERDMFDFIKGFMGLSYIRADDDFREAVMVSQAFADMPCYPEEGFLREIDGNLVIKLPY